MHFRVYEIQNLLAAAKQTAHADSLVAIYRSDIKILSAKIASYEVSMRELVSKDSVNKEIIATYKAMIDTMKEQRTLLENQLALLQRELRRWRRKQFITGVIGGLTTIAFGYLYLTK